MTRLADIYGPGHTQADYQRALAAGYETGWWNEHGVPAPWPDDFLDPNSGWHNASTIDPAPINPGEPPF